MDIQVDEARSLGMRMTVTRGSMNFPRRMAACRPDSVVQDEDTILADCERVIGRYNQRGEGAMIRWRLPRARLLGDEVADVRLRRTGRETQLACTTHLAETQTRTLSAAKSSA